METVSVMGRKQFLYFWILYGTLKKRDNLSEKEAEKTIQEVDEKRAAFQEQCTATKWGDGNEYDLCIDTGKIGVEKTVELILNYIEFKYGK